MHVCPRKVISDQTSAIIPHLAATSGGGGRDLLVYTLTYISTCPSEGTEKYCIKKQQQQHHS